MYKIVENEDGSTGVYSSKTGELICSVNSKKNPVGIGHPIRRTDTPEIAPRTTPQKSLTCNKLSPGKKCSITLESANSLKIPVSPIMKEYADDDDSYGDFPPLPSDDQDSTIGDFSDECISQEEFLQCLNVVPTCKLEQNSIEDLKKEFPLRVISKTATESSCGTTGLSVKILEDVEICSPLGIRVLQSSPHHELDENGVMGYISKCERYCQFSVSSVYCGNVPQLRNRELLTKYPVTYRPLKTWRTDSTFVYSFTKKQRQERLKVLQTGLNRRGRRLKRLCREVSVKLTKLSPKTIQSWVRRKSHPYPSAVSTLNHFGLNRVGNMRSPLMLPGGPFKNGSASFKRPLSLLLMKNIPVKSKNHAGELVNSFTRFPGYGAIKSGFSSVKTSPVKLYLQNSKPRLNPPMKIQQNFSADNGTDDSGDIEILYVKQPCVKNLHPTATYLRNAKVPCNTVKNCSVPLQDVSKQIDRVGGKCFVKGTAIKACGIKSDNKSSRVNSVLMSNNVMSVNCVTSSLLDHAYHRNPLVNSTRQTPSGIPCGNSAAISVKNNVVKATQDRKNIHKTANPRVAASLPGTTQFSPLLIKKDISMLSSGKYTRTVAPPLAHNGLHFKSFKIPPVPLSVKVPQRTSCSVPQRPNVKQVKRNIPVIDITEDNPRDNLPPVKSKPKALKWMFQCYGCGFRSMFFSKLDFDDAISEHMIKKHAVSEPSSLLNSFFKYRRKCNSNRSISWVQTIGGQ